MLPKVKALLKEVFKYNSDEAFAFIRWQALPALQYFSIHKRAAELTSEALWERLKASLIRGGESESLSA